MGRRSELQRPEATWHPDLRGQHSLDALDCILLLLMDTVMSLEPCMLQ